MNTIVPSLTADLLMVLHLVWILFNITGFFWARRWPVLGKIHVLTLGLTVTFALTLGGCPMTDLEWAFRQKAHPLGSQNSGGFISQYLEKMIYINISDEIIFYITLGLFLLSFTLHILIPFIRRFRKSR